MVSPIFGHWKAEENFIEATCDVKILVPVQDSAASDGYSVSTAWGLGCTRVGWCPRGLPWTPRRKQDLAVNYASASSTVRSEGELVCAAIIKTVERAGYLRRVLCLGLVKPKPFASKLSKIFDETAFRKRLEVNRHDLVFGL